LCKQTNFAIKVIYYRDGKTSRTQIKKVKFDQKEIKKKLSPEC